MIKIIIIITIITFSYCLLCRTLKDFSRYPLLYYSLKDVARFFPTFLALLQFERRMQDFSRHSLLCRFPPKRIRKGRHFFVISLFHALLWNHKTLFNFYLHFIFELQDYIIEKQITYNFSTFCFERCIEVSTNRSVTTK